MARKYQEVGMTPAEAALVRLLVSNQTLLPEVERAFVIDIVSFDWNCPQYITPRYTEEEIEAVFTAPLLKRITELEAKLISAGREVSPEFTATYKTKLDQSPEVGQVVARHANQPVQ
jgi:hypothetical protein